MCRRLQNKKLPRRTPKKWAQHRSNSHVSRPQARIKVSGRQRTKAIRMPMRSSHSIRPKASDKERAHRRSELQPDWELEKVETTQGTYLSGRVRQLEQENLGINQGT